MGSRIREKPERLFEVFMEIAKPDGQGEVPFVVQQFPEVYEDKGALGMIPKFVFPCDSDASKVDHFSFVLTDVDSMFRFGYCRHATGHQTCLCIVSWLPWFEIFYKMLDLMAELTNRSEVNQVREFLQAAYDHEVPASKVPVTIVANEEMFNFTAPDPNILPSIPGSRNLTEYYNAVDTANMMLIFASMLHERRIYMTSKKLSRLTSCIFAAESLLYPMHWQHIFIPVLPSYLIEYLSSPIPYLIGVHGNLIPKLSELRVDVADAVVVDLDTNTVTTEFDDLANLPEDVTNSLKKDLKTETLRISMMKTGDAISMAFLKALVKLIGGYRDALKFRPGEPITFDPKAFVQSRSSQSTRAFLEGMLSLQIFMQFIHGRLEILNAGIGFRDIFEQQATFYADKLNSQSRYEKWLEIAKKKSKNGFMGVKVKLKEQSRKAMTKISGLTDNEDKKSSSLKVSGGIVHSKPIKGRPASTMEGSTQKAARPPRPPPPNKHQRDSMKRSQAGSHNEKEESHDDSQLRLSYHTMDMSLMGDSDIQAAMLRSASAEVLPSEQESVGSSSTPSSTSLASEEADGANIPFGTLNSSDEGLNMLVGSDRKSVTPEVPKEDRLPQPVAPPRTKRKSPNPSPVASPQVSASRARPSSTLTSSTISSTPQIPGPPKPLPRQSSLKFGTAGSMGQGQSTATVQDAPLIKFDSSESGGTPDSDVFDPLASSSKSARSPADEGISPGLENAASDLLAEGKEDGEIPKLQRNRESRSSLTRAKAFRRESPGVPLRPSYKDDSPDNSSATSTPKREPPTRQDAFDPLSDLSGLSMIDSGGKPSADPERADHHQQKEVEEEGKGGSMRGSSQLLMREWSLASLASFTKGPTMSLPSHPGKLSQSNNPFLMYQQQQQPQTSSGLHHHSTAAGGGQQSGPRYGMYPSPQQTSASSQGGKQQHYHPHYSLAYAGSGPLPPPGRLPSSFLTPFNHPQQSSSVPLPVGAPNITGPAAPPRPSGSPLLSSSYSKPRTQQDQHQSPASTASVATPSTSHLLLPTPSSAGAATSRRMLPRPPASSSTQATVSLTTQAGSASNSTTPSTSPKKQADLLSDLIGIDFGAGGGGGGGALSGAHNSGVPQPQKPQQTAAPPPPRGSQQKWETFD